MRDTGVTYDLLRMSYRDATAHAYGANGTFTTSLLDAGERAAVKSWRAIGATFAAPEIRGNPASTDPVTLTLDWSIDAGESWTTAATLVASDPTQRVYELAAELPSDLAVSPVPANPGWVCLGFRLVARVDRRLGRLRRARRSRSPSPVDARDRRPRRDDPA